MNHDCRGDGVRACDGFREAPGPGHRLARLPRVRKFALAACKTLAFDCTRGYGAAALLPYKQQSFVLGAACVAAAGVCGNESPRAACGHRKAFGEQSLERGSGHLSRRHHQNCRARQASIDAARTTN